jgi:hypothetical protein
MNKIMLTLRICSAPVAVAALMGLSRTTSIWLVNKVKDFLRSDQRARTKWSRSGAQQ